MNVASAGPFWNHAGNKKAATDFSAAALCSIIVMRISSVLRRPGSDLLSQALRLSTIGAEGLNGRVRDGIGFGPLAKTTRPAKNRSEKKLFWFVLVFVFLLSSHSIE
jgi:hypothetical protein